jgi:hypothetical protein
MPLDVEALAGELVTTIEAATSTTIRGAMAPLEARIKALEAQLAALGPGPPGPAGVGIEAVAYDGERTLTLTFSQGETRQVVMPLSIYRGVFVPHRQYERGDNVTYRGSVWMAQQSTSAWPGSDPRAWQLACKGDRGRREKREPPHGD